MRCVGKHQNFSRLFLLMGLFAVVSFEQSALAWPNWLNKLWKRAHHCLVLFVPARSSDESSATVLSELPAVFLNPDSIDGVQSRNVKAGPPTPRDFAATLETDGYQLIRMDSEIDRIAEQALLEEWDGKELTMYRMSDGRWLKENDVEKIEPSHWKFYLSDSGLSEVSLAVFERRYQIALAKGAVTEYPAESGIVFTFDLRRRGSAPVKKFHRDGGEWALTQVFDDKGDQGTYVLGVDGNVFIVPPHYYLLTSSLHNSLFRPAIYHASSPNSQGRVLLLSQMKSPDTSYRLEIEITPNKAGPRK